MSREIHIEAALCPVHRWTTEIHQGRCGVRDSKGDRCGERFSHTYTFLPLHEHDEALCDLRASLTQPDSTTRLSEDGLRERLLFNLKFDKEPYTLEQIEAAYDAATNHKPQDEERS